MQRLNSYYKRICKLNLCETFNTLLLKLIRHQNKLSKLSRENRKIIWVLYLDGLQTNDSNSDACTQHIQCDVIQCVTAEIAQHLFLNAQIAYISGKKKRNENNQFVACLLYSSNVYPMTCKYVVIMINGRYSIFSSIQSKINCQPTLNAILAYIFAPNTE